MNISDNSYNFISGIKSDIIKVNDKNPSSSANADIIKVAQGDRFNGQITGITNDQVTILLDNNKTLSAHMADSMMLNIGDTMLFEVKENNGGNVVIHPFLEQLSEMKNNTILSILEMNGVSPTEKNYNIADSLMRNNMSVDKANMQKVMQQAYKYPDASVDTLVSLNKLGIVVNEANIKQYNDYLNNNHQLINDLKAFGGEIIAAQSEIIADMNDFSSIIALNSDVLKILSDENDLANASFLKELIYNGQSIEADNIEGNISSGKLMEPEVDKTALLTSNIALEEAVTDNKSVTNTAQLSEKLQLAEKGIVTLFDELKNLGIESGKLHALMNNSDTPLQLFNNLNELIKHTTDKDKTEAIKSFLGMDDYKELLESAIKDKLLLNPKEMENPHEIDDLYNSIYQKTNKLMNLLSHGGSSSNTFEQQAKSVNERLDFIQNLNEMYAYAQIPVKLDNNELNSELFVYMNKKGIKSSKEAVSALLHLDMAYLGPTDVHVSLHGNIVTTKFYVEDELSARILDEHMTMLEKAVNENGFILNNEVITREPTIINTPNAVVGNMIDSELEKSVKRYSFDVRM